MLDDPRTVRIAGDDTAAPFRRAGDVDADDRPDDHRGGPVPEAYVWCNLTFGNSTRALWLLPLPFMVVNLAHWMRPTVRGRSRTVRCYGLLVRLVGLTLTVLLVAAACEVALDVAAWQRAGTHACAVRHSWLGFLSPDSPHGWWSRPGRRLALAAVVPAALTGLLWYLSRRTWSAYESVRPVPQVGEPDEDGDPTSLGRPGFWYSRRPVARLRAAHTAAGMLRVAVASSATRFDRGPDGPAALSSLHREVDCWRNLFRLTDPIGGPVRLSGDCGPEVDRPPLKDPLAYGRAARHPLPAPILGHSDYQADPAFAEERARLLARLGPRLPAPREREKRPNSVAEPVAHSELTPPRAPHVYIAAVPPRTARATAPELRQAAALALVSAVAFLVAWACTRGAVAGSSGTARWRRPTPLRSSPPSAPPAWASAPPSPPWSRRSPCSPAHGPPPPTPASPRRRVPTAQNRPHRIPTPWRTPAGQSRTGPGGPPGRAASGRPSTAPRPGRPGPRAVRPWPRRSAVRCGRCRTPRPWGSR